MVDPLLAAASRGVRLSGGGHLSILSFRLSACPRACRGASRQPSAARPSAQLPTIQRLACLSHSAFAPRPHLVPVRGSAARSGPFRPVPVRCTFSAAFGPDRSATLHPRAAATWARAWGPASPAPRPVGSPAARQPGPAPPGSPPVPCAIPVRRGARSRRAPALSHGLIGVQTGSPLGFCSGTGSQAHAHGLAPPRVRLPPDPPPDPTLSSRRPPERADRSERPIDPQDATWARARGGKCEHGGPPSASALAPLLTNLRGRVAQAKMPGFTVLASVESSARCSTHRCQRRVTRNRSVEGE